MSARAWRLFFALWPDPGTAERCDEVARTLCGHAPARLVPLDRLHMTLQFLGSRAPEQLAQIRAAATRVRGRPFDLSLDRSGYWKRAGVAWLAPGETPPALLDLVTSLRTVLEGVGIPAETRPFRPHVTVARKSRGAPVGLLETALGWQVDHFRLVRSETRQSGAEYSELARWPLIG